MTSVSQIELNVCRAYIRHIQETFQPPTYESAKFLLILQIYEWQLSRANEQKPATFDQLMTMKHGVREAETFLSGAVAPDIAELLWAVVLELTQAISANESLYPELRSAFNREREQYRQMKLAAEEAESLA